MMLWVFLCPMVCLPPPPPSSHHSVGQGLRRCSPHLNAFTNTFLNIWGLLYACSLLFTRVLPSCWSSILSFLKAPRTRGHLRKRRALWCWYPKCKKTKTWEATFMSLIEMYAFTFYDENTTSEVWKRNSQTFVSWSIWYSTTWIFLLQNQIDHALLHICLCIHMQCILLHVHMSMRPMVLSMICLIYGLDTLINH